VKPATVYDIAKALDISTGTVHRALHNAAGINPATKKKVLQMAKRLGYRPNMAARFLSQKRKLQVSVNTLQGTTSFWDEVRAGVEEEAKAQGMDNVEISFRTFPSLSEGDEAAFESAMTGNADGIITFPSRPVGLRKWIRGGPASKVPVVCVVTDAPESGRVGVVTIDTEVSGSLAADLMGRFLQGRGKIAVTVSDAQITEHAEKYGAFENTIETLYPEMALVGPIEDHDLEGEAYAKSRELFSTHPDLAGIYITTEASIPVIQAARDAKMLERLTIITTDLFPALIEEMRQGSVAATIFQRPRTQGRMAYRLLHEYMVDGACSTGELTLSPHLVTRGNLEYFLKGQSFNLESKLVSESGEQGAELAASSGVPSRGGKSKR
jgi:LacI family transcriptional regulator